MTSDPLQPLDDAAWADIKARYELGTEPIKAIAADARLPAITLSMKAKAWGWLMRKPARAAAKAESTQATLRRLKDIVHKRIAVLEKEIADIGAEVDKLDHKRAIGDVNTLVRTLEKVLDLERKNKARKRGGTAAAFKRLDEAERDALAQKLEGLGREWAGAAFDEALAAAGGDRDQPRMDDVGAAGASVPAAP